MAASGPCPSLCPLWSRIKGRALTDRQRKQHHNRVDPQAPTKTDLPAPVFFPALLHRRVSHPNHFYLPFPYFAHFYQAFPWPSCDPMARPRRTEEGSSRKRDRKVQPPRPPNAWILYRSKKFALIRETNERLSQAAVSKRISIMWRNETEQIRRQFEREAEEKKAEHQERYPDYRFCPQRKETKSRKKSKAREATPSDVDDVDEDGDAPFDMPTLPPMPYMPQPLPQHYNVLGYQPMPQPYTMPYLPLPEAHYGPGGPSPPMSAAPSPSPAPYEGSLSPANVPSSSSSPSTRPSSSSESQASFSSSQLPSNPMYLPSLPTSHQPSPNPYATQPLSTLLFQTPAPGELSLPSPRVQLQSAENTLAPAVPDWNNIPTQLPSPGSQNSEVSFRGTDEPLRFLNNF